MSIIGLTVIVIGTPFAFAFLVYSTWISASVFWAFITDRDFRIDNTKTLGRHTWFNVIWIFGMYFIWVFMHALMWWKAATKFIAFIQ